jgi:hypothetical protein
MLWQISSWRDQWILLCLCNVLQGESSDIKARILNELLYSSITTHIRLLILGPCKLFERYKLPKDKKQSVYSIGSNEGYMSFKPTMASHTY